MAGEIKQIVETKAKDAPVKDILWNAAQLSSEPVRIVDPGVGKAHVLRHFFFKKFPRSKGTPAPSKLDVINHFKRLIEITLWGDGLIIREDKPIELHTLKKARKISPTLHSEMLKHGADFCILVLAYPRAGVTVLEKPERLV